MKHIYFYYGFSLDKLACMSLDNLPASQIRLITYIGCQIEIGDFVFTNAVSTSSTAQRVIFKLLCHQNGADLLLL